MLCDGWSGLHLLDFAGRIVSDRCLSLGTLRDLWSDVLHSGEIPVRALSNAAKGLSPFQERHNQFTDKRLLLYLAVMVAYGFVQIYSQPYFLLHTGATSLAFSDFAV